MAIITSNKVKWSALKILITTKVQVNDFQNTFSSKGILRPGIFIFMRILFSWSFCLCILQLRFLSDMHWLVASWMNMFSWKIGGWKMKSVLNNYPLPSQQIINRFVFSVRLFSVSDTGSRYRFAESRKSRGPVLVWNDKKERRRGRIERNCELKTESRETGFLSCLG